MKFTAQRWSGAVQKIMGLVGNVILQLGLAYAALLKPLSAYRRTPTQIDKGS